MGLVTTFTYSRPIAEEMFSQVVPLLPLRERKKAQAFIDEYELERVVRHIARCVTKYKLALPSGAHAKMIHLMNILGINYWKKFQGIYLDPKLS